MILLDVVHSIAEHLANTLNIEVRALGYKGEDGKVLSIEDENGEHEYIGITDNRSDYAYIRLTNNNIRTSKQDNDSLGSCRVNSKWYRESVDLRIVVMSSEIKQWFFLDELKVKLNNIDFRKILTNSTSKNAEIFITGFTGIKEDIVSQETGKKIFNNDVKLVAVDFSLSYLALYKSSQELTG